LEEHEIETADLILVMEEVQRRQIFYYSPDNMHKVILFSELIDEQSDLADPYGKNERAYVATLQRIDQVLTRGWRKLLRLLRVKAPTGEKK
jgi:protein-tyrosine-phosphatase